MKPAPFDYQAPGTLREAIDLLGVEPRGGRHRRRTKPDAGSRLPPGDAEPAGRSAAACPELGNIAVGDDGVRLGASVRWRDIEDDQRLATAHPLLREAVAHVAHYQIRNRGTVGGSLAHADPAAELPGVAVTCEGEITLVGPAGSRTVRAGEFFTGPLSTLAPAGRDHHRTAPAVLAERTGAGPSENSRGARAISPSPAFSCFMTRTRRGSRATRMSA